MRFENQLTGRSLATNQFALFAQQPGQIHPNHSLNQMVNKNLGVHLDEHAGQTHAPGLRGSGM